MSPVIAALLTCNNQDLDMKWELVYTREEVAIIRIVLFDDEDRKLLEVSTIMENIVYVTEYNCIGQFILLLRQLTEQTHGNDATELDCSTMGRFVQKEAREFWANRTFSGWTT
ncbi:hypothetical protein E2P81_ATG11159 [Venturia nashicola]|uniref:Uncharacterized protein n=1 Tax=Venturia nashicola TaxID=86259 RepID=A0A4Z1P2F9_9PEZI|nr:hypothetical protein E6O75_ATG10839 [Venturia nashicola]TLD35040.1 hypothetical protein E2P81_ATG11159 [Venturia nashicola]